MKINIVEVCHVEDGIVKVGSHQVGSAEIDFTEVWLYLWMHFSPLIPSDYSPLEDIEMFLVCHIMYSHLRAIRVVFIRLRIVYLIVKINVERGVVLIWTLNGGV